MKLLLCLLHFQMVNYLCMKFHWNLLKPIKKEQQKVNQRNLEVLSELSPIDVRLILFLSYTTTSPLCMVW